MVKREIVDKKSEVEDAVREVKAEVERCLTVQLSHVLSIKDDTRRRREDTVNQEKRLLKTSTTDLELEVRSKVRQMKPTWLGEDSMKRGVAPEMKQMEETPVDFAVEEPVRKTVQRTPLARLLLEVEAPDTHSTETSHRKLVDRSTSRNKPPRIRG